MASQDSTTATDSTSATVTGVTRADRSLAYELGTTLSPVGVYPASGLLPAVTAVEGQPEGWDRVGMRRTLRLHGRGGRGSVVEQIVLTEPDAHFAYELSSFTGAIGLLVTGGRADWWFEPEPAGGTRVTWRYRFHPRPGRRGLVAQVVRRAWAPYMALVLPRLLQELDAAAARTAS